MWSGASSGLLVDGRLEDPDVGQVAVLLRVVQAVPHHKEVVHGEAGVVGGDGLGAAGGLIQQGAQPDGGRVPGLEELEQAALTGDGYYSQLPASLPFQEAAVPGAEAFRFRRDGIHWEILAQKDRRALLLSYEGSRDLSQWFPQIVQLLTQTSEP